MLRKVLVAGVAAVPLMTLAFPAAAFDITGSTSTPQATSTVNNGAAADINITSTGQISAAGSNVNLVTLDSNNSITNAGSLTGLNVSNVAAFLLRGGFTGQLDNQGGVSFNEDFVASTDANGNVNGPLSQQSGLYGIRVIGPGTLTGAVINNSGANISIRGNDSYGISVETPIVGNLSNFGTVAALGYNAYGIRTTAPVTGDFLNLGSVTSTGKGAVAIAVDADVTGVVKIQGAITSYGYTYTTRPDDATIAKLNPFNLLLGGTAVRIGGNVGAGLLIDVPPTQADGTIATTDTDGDGTADNLEGTGSIVLYGSAPALTIGSDSRSITLGNVGTGDTAYGAVLKGVITANGVYDGFSATGVQIGTDAGNMANLTGGIRLYGSINVSAFEANTTALWLKPGAVVPTFRIDGSLTSSSTAVNQIAATGVLIEKGATLSTLINSNTMVAQVTGPKGDAFVVVDRSGTLSTINNTGVISALHVANDLDTDPTHKTLTGRLVAFDLSANTTGVNITQTGVNRTITSTVNQTDTDGDGIIDLYEPSILGDILLGSGADQLNVLNGVVIGSVSFGAGKDVLTVDGTGVLRGGITDSDGQLSISVGKGTLSVTNAETINATSIALGGQSTFQGAVDPTTNQNTKFVVATANVAAGAKIGVTVKHLFDNPTRYVLIQAGSLSLGGPLSQDLLGDAPYLYVVTAGADVAAGQVYVDARRRTTAEIGLNAAQTAAYNAVFQTLKNDTPLESAFLSRLDRGSFLNLYNQMLPDQGQGLFNALQTANQQISLTTGQRPDPYQRYGPDSVWAQEINTLVRREDGGSTLGTDTQVFGFATGYESMGENGGALGATLSYLNAQEHDNAASVGEYSTAAVVQGGLYWRRAVGGLVLNVGGGGGYAWMFGHRTLLSPDDNGDGIADVSERSRALWSGYLGSAFAGVSYQADIGRFYLRPEARIDYLYFKEDARKEKGPDSAFDVLVAARTSSNASAAAEIAFGAQYGRDSWIRPEVRIGYRQTVGGTMGSTVATFAGGSPFTLLADNNRVGAVTLNFALKAGTPMSYVALEAGAERARRLMRYNLRLAGRMMF